MLLNIIMPIIKDLFCLCHFKGCYRKQVRDNLIKYNFCIEHSLQYTNQSNIDPNILFHVDKRRSKVFN